MKKFILLCMMFITSYFMFGQSPQSFNYQAVVRNSLGAAIPNQPVGMQVSILIGPLPGIIVYSETFNVTTNNLGIVNVAVGSGMQVSGNFGTITWGNGEYYINIQIDPAGGTSYVDMGTTQLLSVPYALHAKTSEDAFSGNYTDLSGAPVNLSQFTNDAGYITSSTEADGDPTNELQVLSISNDTIFLSNGGFVKLPTGFSGNYNDLTGVPTNLSQFNNDAGYVTTSDDADADPLNEIQALTLNGNDLSISDGNTVTLPQSSLIAGTGINISGNTISNTAPDQNITLSGSGATTITGTYPNFIINSTDNNTTYSAGTGLTLSGSIFNSTWTSSGSNIYNNNTGYVGIGNNSPSSPLHIYTTASASSAKIGYSSLYPDNKLYFGDASYVYVGEDGVDDRLGLKGSTLSLNITSGGGLGTSGQVLKSNGTTASWSNETITAVGTGLSITGTTINNTAPDVTVTLTGSGATSVSGTYPNFTISSTDNNTLYTNGNGLALTGTTFSLIAPVTVGNGGTGQTSFTNGQLLIGNSTGNTLTKSTLTAGSGISITNGAGAITITNSAPDQSITITGGGATSVSGTYPVFSITSTDNNTTYTAGTGLTLSGTQFSHNAHSGDVSGTTALTVTGIQNKTVSTTTPTSGQILKYNGTSWAPAADNVDDADNNPSNEIQSLSLLGNTLSLSGSNSVSMSGYVDTLWKSNGNMIYNSNSGNVGVGIMNPLGKMVVKGDAILTDSDPLFEVKDRTGATVFVVYPDSVRIFVGDDNSKTNKGAFAVSGRNTVKALTHDYLVVRPDSTRIYTNDSTKGFGVSNVGSTIQKNYMSLTQYNTFIGHLAGNHTVVSGSNGMYNNFIGYNAGYDNVSGSRNVWIGHQAGLHSTSSYTVFIGNEAGYNCTGSYNVFIGDSSGVSNLGGNGNTFIGYRAGRKNLSSFNLFFGYQAGLNNNSGNNNAFIGNNAGATNTTGSNNIFFGTQSGVTNSTGGYNTYIGSQSGFMSTGSRNIFIGYQAGFNETGNDKLYIDVTNTSTPLILGDFAANRATINDILRLAPRAAAPAAPLEGDVYVNSATLHAYCYIGGAWKQLDN